MRFALARAAVGAVLLVIAMSVVMVSVEALPRPARVLWPSLLAALCMVLVYNFYARRIERRPGNAFALPQAPLEFAMGLLGGGGLVGAVFGSLTALGVFEWQGRHAFGVTALTSLSDVVLVAFFEEILVRGIVLTALERPLGSRLAVLASALLFGVAHLPNQGATMLSTLNVTMAGILFGTAFLATRRLWLGIALHLGWNFTAGYLFSATVSGHDGQAGLFYGQLHGPDWITGGAFGVEGSVATLVALTAASSVLMALASRLGPRDAARQFAHQT
ncbi:MAG TPA: CPBP family intramembrane glutamic endopeptidase [Vicinamibacterales bacterium]|nr:CPBP family intramembrane glutamic endopeptidase [Vicinamibacterales bacterium]